MPLLLHGLLEASRREAVADGSLDAHVGGEVELVDEGRLLAVVTPTDDPEVLPSRANLMAHTRLLEALAARVTVAPVRFGVVVDDHDALTATMRERHDHLLEVLGRLAGHREFRLRGRYEQDEVVREVLAADERAARLKGAQGVDARMELGERIVAGIEARRDTDRERALAALDEHVTDVAVGAPAEPLDAFTVSLLIDEQRQAAFDAALDDLGARVAPTLALELVGPVPPFSFVDVGGP